MRIMKRIFKKGFRRPCRTCAGTSNALIECCSPDLSTVKLSLSSLCSAGTVQFRAHNEMYLMQCNGGYKLGAILCV